MGANCISVREEFTMSQTSHARVIIFDHPFLSFPLEGYGNFYLLSLHKILGHNTPVNSQGYLSRQPSSTGKFYSQELMGKITQVACCFKIAYTLLDTKLTASKKSCAHLLVFCIISTLNCCLQSLSH